METSDLCVRLDQRGEVVVVIPSPSGGERTLRLDPEKGMAQLAHLLFARKEPGPHTVGTHGAPTQQMLDRFDSSDPRYAHLVKRYPPQDPHLTISLEDLGL